MKPDNAVRDADDGDRLEIEALHAVHGADADGVRIILLILLAQDRG